MESSSWVKCCVPKCVGSGGTTKTIQYYTFPLDKKQKNQWICALKKVNLFEKIAEISGVESVSDWFICSRHFNPGDFETSSKFSAKLRNQSKVVTQALRKNAVPSVFPVMHAMSKRKRESDGGAVTVNLESSPPKQKKVTITGNPASVKDESKCALPLASKAAKAKRDTNLNLSNNDITKLTVHMSATIQSLGITKEKTEPTTKRSANPPSKAVTTIPVPKAQRIKEKQERSSPAKSVAEIIPVDRNLSENDAASEAGPKNARELRAPVPPRIKPLAKQTPVKRKTELAINDVTKRMSATIQSLGNKKADPVVADSGVGPIRFRGSYKSKLEKASTAPTEVQSYNKEEPSSLSKSLWEIIPIDWSLPETESKSVRDPYSANSSSNMYNDLLTLVNTPSGPIERPVFRLKKKTKKPTKEQNIKSAEPERKVPVAIASMLSVAINKVITDNTMLGKRKGIAQTAQQYQPELNLVDQSTSQRGDFVDQLLNEKTPWVKANEGNKAKNEDSEMNNNGELEEDELRHYARRSQLRNRIDSDSSDETDVKEDNTFAKQQNVSVINERDDSDMNEDEYATPLLNGFGLDAVESSDSDGSADVKCFPLVSEEEAPGQEYVECSTSIVKTENLDDDYCEGLTPDITIKTEPIDAN